MTSLAAAALALEGVPFRLHGRDPATGLDCIGVLAQALQAIGRERELPNGYRLRTRALPQAEGIAQQCGLAPTEDDRCEAGDVLLLQVGPCQFHLAIAAGERGIVHADARLRRVVVDPLPPRGRIVGHWRLADPTSGD